MNNQKAFILPVVLALATVAGMLLVACWWVTGLQMDIVTQREQWYNHLYATEQVLNDGVAAAQKEFDRIIKRLMVAKAPLVWELAPSPARHDRQPVSGVITIGLPKKGKTAAVVADQLVMHATARIADRSVGSVRCLLTKVVRSTGKGKENHFVVSHCTFDHSV